jgi:hypothetical protein
MGRTAIGKLLNNHFQLVSSYDRLSYQFISFHDTKFYVSHTAPGLKRIAVTLRLKKPRTQLHQAINNSAPISSSPTLPSATALRHLDADSYTPSHSVIRHLIDLYYSHASFMFPWESKSTILSDIDADAASACLVYSMCAIGAR